jgi:hypothetical protein
VAKAGHRDEGAAVPVPDKTRRGIVAHDDHDAHDWIEIIQHVGFVVLEGVE